MKRLAWLFSLLLLLALLGACAPATGFVAAPSFRFVPEGSGLVRLEPPGVGAGAAVFRVNLEATNPNAFGVTLAGLDFELALNGRRAAASRFVGGVSLAPQGSSPLALEVAVPLVEGVALLGDLARLIAGESTRYTLTGAVTLEVLGVRQRLPSATLAAGEVRQPLALLAPEVRLVPERSGLREFTPKRAVIEVGLELHNPGPLGYLFRAPDLALYLSDIRLGQAGLVREPVRPFARTPVALRFEFNPLSLGAAAAQLAAGSPLNVGVQGEFALELPGIAAQTFPARELARGVLR
jgi:hypothetical protein